MIAFVSVAHPALLWGLSVVAVPVLIHWLLRPAPRRLRFPALGLMRGVLTTGRRASQLRNVLLMVLRTALLAVLVLCLATPTCAPRTAGVAGDMRTACVVVLDDSLSSRYRPRFEEADTQLDQSRAAAVEFVEVIRGWPVGSELAASRAGDIHESVTLAANPVTALGILRDRTRDAPHAQPLGRALDTAGRLLRAAQQPRRRLMIFTDGAASAWRDVRPATLAGIKDLEIHVVTPATTARSNLGISAATPPTHVWPASAAVPIRTTVRNVGVDGEYWLVAREGAQVVARIGPLRISADSQQEVVVALPPSSPGPHAITLALEPEDLLAADQQRHVAWQSAAQPLVWLLAPRHVERTADLTPLLLTNLLAPELLSGDEQRVQVRRLDSAEIANEVLARASETRQNPAVIIALPGAGVEAAAREAVVRMVERGAVLALLPNSGATRLDWPGLRSLLSESAPEVESLPAATAIRGNAPVVDGGPTGMGDELTRCAVQRRVRLAGLLDGVHVDARYLDDVPAIVSRRVGRGRVVALTTSPDPVWSDLGVRAAGLLTWLHALVDEALGSPTAVGQFTVGEEMQTAFPALPVAGLVQVARSGDAQSAPTWLRLADGRPRESWPTDKPGVYTIRVTGTEVRAQYVVNWPAEEFDLTPIQRAGLVRALGTERVTLERTGAPATTTSTGWFARVLRFADTGWTLGLVLLLLFVLEMGAAARPSRPVADSTRRTT